MKEVRVWLKLYNGDEVTERYYEISTNESKALVEDKYGSDLMKEGIHKASYRERVIPILKNVFKVI